jgi:hypothetical protein
MRATLCVLLICATVNGQNSRAQLNQRYGTSRSETFNVRPNVFLTVSYTETEEICEMIVHPQRLTESLDSPITRTIASSELTEIIDELVPVNQRGKRLMGTFLNLICLPLNNCGGTMDSYELVTILRNGGNNKERYATIRWKHLDCR